ncbi:putative transcription factor TIFY family [Rosa chinensis]|uniref:Protein TIFY n=1 Tax=Rosa chinensis TaxID=74649 RepID=A0A2P6S0U9_ROSCH|nr:protein TIFY 5A-like [Rosa chinensis]PRQ52295.1 putative transcription factor TIFY family [Rosa chinensis]
MAMEKCSSKELDLGLPPMTVDSLSQMIYRKALMDDPTSQEPITIFYDGRVYVFDIMELQVRAIILFATREMEGGMTSRSSKETVSLALQSQILVPPCGSVKKSLQTFLQNRKNEASDPYSHNS